MAVAWVREGRITGTSGDTAFEVLPGQALLWDTRYALESRIEQDLRLLRVIVDLAEMPAPLIAAAPRPAALLRDSPLVRSTLAFAGTLLQESRRADRDDGDDVVVAHAVIALMTGLVAELEHQQRAADPHAHQDRRAAIETYIGAHLADPGLGPTSVSRDFGISVRSVHAAFSGSGTTVAAAIRCRRVEAVQQTLHGLAGLPRMTELALQHGFRDTSQLSRAFRDQSGMPVREWWAARRR